MATLQVQPLTAPTIDVQGDSYRFVWADTGVTAEIERIVESRDGMHGEVVIRSQLHGLLHAARLNLLSTQARNAMAKALAERVNHLDWGGMLEAMCFLTVERYREGEPAIDLATWQPDRREHWLLYPYVSFAGPTILFAEGMTGKSLLALAMSYTVATGDQLMGKPTTTCNVLYLDWETGPDTHWQRLRAIANDRFAEAPHIIYRYMAASLPETAGIIRRDIAKHNVRMVVVDSLGAAGNGAPEDASTAIALFQAIRTFKDCAVLCLHHKNKGTEKGGVTGRNRLFGSAYYFNFARLVWELDAVHQEGSDSSTVGMICHKNNYGRLFQRHAWRLRFGSDSAGEMQGVRFERLDVSEVPELAAGLPLREQIAMELKRGARSTMQLTEALGADHRQVASRLQELKRAGRIIRLDDGSWGLAAAASGM